MNDAIISRRSETKTETTDFITIRCGRCAGTFERSVHWWSKTFACPHCTRRCHVDTAIRAADALPDGVTPLFTEQPADPAAEPEMETLFDRWQEQESNREAAQRRKRMRPA